MAKVSDIIEYCDQTLNTQDFRDYAPNGLQVEGKSEIKHLVSGVTASMALIDAAIEQGADAIFVHHGYFWKGENPTLTGIKGRRIKKLMQHDINLIGYHLPLDAHPVYGNNARLGEVLGLVHEAIVGTGPAKGTLYKGRLEKPMSAVAFADQIEKALGRKPLHIPGGKDTISSLAWCTGGAQGFIDQAVELGVDAYISGEISEKTTHSAIEEGIHYYAAGHHATERYGAPAFAEHLAEVFGFKHSFIDIDNPV